MLCNIVQAEVKESRSMQCSGMQGRLKGKKVHAVPAGRKETRSKQCTACSQIWTDGYPHIIKSVSISMHPNLGVSNKK